MGSRAVLRQLKGHQRPVHVARFSPDKLHVLSGGDDATVRFSPLHCFCLSVPQPVHEREART